jgi:hypothetical protein
MNDEQLIWESYLNILNENKTYTKNELIQQLITNGNINETDAEKILNYYTTDYYEALEYYSRFIQLDPATSTYKLSETRINGKPPESLFTDKDRIKYSLVEVKEHEKHTDVNEFYHAGPKILKVKDIEFNRGSLGFHVGKQELVDFISQKKGYFYDRKGTFEISKFGVKYNCGNGKEIIEIDEDLPWEDPVLLTVLFCYHGLIKNNDAITILNHFGYEDNRDLNDFDEYNMDHEDSLFQALDNMNKGKRSYHPVEDIGIVNPDSDFYKNQEALEYLRNYLVNLGWSGIEYPNEAEGSLMQNSQISICILDKCSLSDIN